MTTGIYLRVRIGSRWESVDIGSPTMPIDALLAWLGGLDAGALRRTVLILLRGQKP